MKLYIKIGLLFMLCGALWACGDDDNEYDPIKQQDDFKAFLDDKEIPYDRNLGQDYIFKVTLPDSMRIVNIQNSDDIVKDGDQISMYYIGWTFSRSARDPYGRQGVFATNIAEVAMAIGLDIPEVNEYHPLSVKVGDKSVLPGLNRGIPGSPVGDGFLLYLSADLAYGGWDQIGLIDTSMPVIYEIYILEKNNN